MNSPIVKLIVNSLKYRFNLDEDKASETEVIENIKKAVEFKGINLWTLIFAIFIASIGLNVNSTAVIIGAMLISPIMGPIMGIGLGAGIFDFELIKSALKNLLIAFAIGLITSAFYFFITPLKLEQSEILSRTSPTIWDVLIAFSGGLAGIVASSRKKFNNVIPGVAIATALMPPLCTAGYGLANGNGAYFFGAFYLFLINSVFISIATFLIVRFLKFKTHVYINETINKKVKNWVSLIGILTIIPSVYLAYNFVGNEFFKQHANSLLATEVTGGGAIILSKNIDPKKKEIHITILDFTKVDSIRKILETRKTAYKLDQATIIVNSAKFKSNPDFSPAALKDGIIEDLFKNQEELLVQKENEIRYLKHQNKKEEQFEATKKGAVEEFTALFGEPKELVIERSVLYEHAKEDTLLFVYLKTKNTFSAHEISRIQNWFKAKFNLKKVMVLNH